MSKKFKSTGRKTLSVFLSATTTMWLAGSSMLIPIAASADHTPIHTLEQKIQQLTAELAALTGGSTGGTAVSCTFTKPLGPGSTGEEVRCLQKYLNANNFQVSATGAGSPGSESAYYGSKTQAAVKKWQDANNIAYGNYAGYFGPKSQAVFNATAVVTPPPPGPPGPPPPPGVGTGLTVSAGTQVASSLAVQNAINVAYTKVKFTASADGDVVVNSLTVERTGLMNDAALAGIILLDEQGNRLGLAKTLNSNHQVILTEPFTVKAGQTREMTLAGDMAASLTSYAGQFGYLTLVAVNTSAIVNETLPITGVGHTVNSSLSVGSVTLAIGANDPGASNTKEVGTKGYIFGAIKGTAGSAEDMVWQSVRFNQSGSASKDDLENVVIVDVTTGTAYPVTVSTDGKYYSANFGAGLSMKKGDNREVYIKGDILSGSDRTINFDLYRYSDAVFKGVTFGYAVKPTASEVAAVADDGAFHSANPNWDGRKATVGKGSLRVEADNNAVPAQNVVAGGNQVPFGAFKFEARGEPVTFTSWVMNIATTDSDSGGESSTILSVTVYDASGKAVAGPTDPASNVRTVTLTDSVTIPVGINTYTVKGNLSSTGWENNDTIIISIQTPATKITSVTGQSTGNAITPTPSSNVTATTITVKAGALTVTPATSLPSQNVIAPSTGVELGRFTLDAVASGDDLRVTSAAIRKTVTGFTGSGVSGLKLMSGTTQLNTGTNVVNPSGNTENLTFTLDNNLTVTKGTSQTLNLIGNLASTATAGGTLKFDFAAGSPDWAVTTKAQGTAVTETLNTAAGATMTIKGAGGYSVAVDSSAPIEKWVAGGATGVTINVLRFTGTTEELSLTDLRLQIDTTGSSTGADFAAIELWDGGTLVQRKVSPAFTDGVEDFSSLPPTGPGSFVIPKDGFKLMTIKADLATIGTNQAGTAGQLIGADFDGAGTPAGVGKQKARGKDSGSSIHSSTATDQNGNGIVTFRSVPTVERQALTSTTLSGGEKVLYRFKVSADPKYDVALNRVTFRIATTGGANFNSSSSFRLFNVTDNKYVNVATGALAAYYGGDQPQNGNYDSNDQLIVRMIADTAADYTVAYVTIPAGQYKEFEFRGAPVTDGTGDSVSTVLLGDAARPVNVVVSGEASGTNHRMGKVTLIDLEQSANETTGKNANAATSTNFIWSDFSSDATTTHSVSTADWTNGFRLPGLPTTGLSGSSLTN